MTDVYLMHLIFLQFIIYPHRAFSLFHYLRMSGASPPFSQQSLVDNKVTQHIIKKQINKAQEQIHIVNILVMVLLYRSSATCWSVIQ
jgi:hypothetical protein